VAVDIFVLYIHLSPFHNTHRNTEKLHCIYSFLSVNTMSQQTRFTSASEVTRALRINTTVGYYNNYPQDQKRAYASTYTSFRAGVTSISGYTPTTTNLQNRRYFNGFVQTGAVGEKNTLDTYVSNNIINQAGPPGEVLYATYPRGSQPSPPYITLFRGDYTVTVAGAQGGFGYAYNQTGTNGGLVAYTFRNIPVGTPIYYIVGGQGENSYNAGGGGAGSAVSIGDITVIAGGGNGHYVEQQDPGYPQGAGGTVWGDSPIPNILTSLNGVQGDLDPSGGAGGGDNPGSGSGPVGSVITSADTVGSGYVRIVYSPPLSMAPFSTLPVSLSRTRY
jgi:hypothetical protein